VNGGRSSRAQTALLLVCGVVAGPLFVMTFIAEGATRADYSPPRHSISSLARGPSGWVQTVNFLAAGGLSLAFAVGLRASLRGTPRPRWEPILVGCGLWDCWVPVRSSPIRTAATRQVARFRSRSPRAAWHFAQPVGRCRLPRTDRGLSGVRTPLRQTGKDWLVAVLRRQRTGCSGLRRARRVWFRSHRRAQ